MKIARGAGRSRVDGLLWYQSPSSRLPRLQPTRRLGADWEAAYGYRPLLLESFVEAQKFQGHLPTGSTSARPRAAASSTATTSSRSPSRMSTSSRSTAGSALSSHDASPAPPARISPLARPPPPPSSRRTADQAVRAHAKGCPDSHSSHIRLPIPHPPVARIQSLTTDHGFTECVRANDGHVQ